jgi:hypothetical protein
MQMVGRLRVARPGSVDEGEIGCVGHHHRAGVHHRQASDRHGAYAASAEGHALLDQHTQWLSQQAVLAPHIHIDRARAGVIGEHGGGPNEKPRLELRRRVEPARVLKLDVITDADLDRCRPLRLQCNTEPALPPPQSGPSARVKSPDPATLYGRHRPTERCGCPVRCLPSRCPHRICSALNVVTIIEVRKTTLQRYGRGFENRRGASTR